MLTSLPAIASYEHLIDCTHLPAQGYGPRGSGLTTNRGVTETGSILDRIVADGREDLARRKREMSEAALRDRSAMRDGTWDLSMAITTPRGKAPAGAIQIIAEIKKSSPSKGVL